MSKVKIEEKIDSMREDEAFDSGYLELLSQSNTGEEATNETVRKIIGEIEKRYAEDKKD